MITCVTYSGDKTARFDREYYVQTHLPLVRKVWGHVGLEAIDAFFPADTGAGFIAIAVCRFRDAAAFQAAFAEPGTAEVMADVQHFTDIEPARFQLGPITALDKDGEDA